VTDTERLNWLLTHQAPCLEFDNHHRLYNAFVRDLKALCRKPDHRFKPAVSVKAILDLEQRYAEAELRMFDRATARLQEKSA
jgi:hypothetical protein